MPFSIMDTHTQIWRWNRLKFEFKAPQMGIISSPFPPWTSWCRRRSLEFFHFNLRLPKGDGKGGERERKREREIRCLKTLLEPSLLWESDETAEYTTEIHWCAYMSHFVLRLESLFPQTLKTPHGPLIKNLRLDYGTNEALGFVSLWVISFHKEESLFSSQRPHQ